MSGPVSGVPIKGLMRVPVRDLHPNPANPRENLTEIEELARSIDEVGLLQPIIAQREPTGRLVVLAGHRRLAAVKLLRWVECPVIVRKELMPDEQLLAMMIENGQRANLDPIEEARAIRTLKAHTGLNDVAVASKIGRSQPWVSGRLALLALSVEEQEEIRAGAAPVTHAIERARVESGRTRPGAKGKDTGWHLGPRHPLATKARTRCNRLGHLKGRRTGGVACGECWESVIRADERDHLHEHSAKSSTCGICGGRYGQ